MDTGFFTKEQTKSKSRPDGKIYSCFSCGLYKNCVHPKMKPQGNFTKGILIIAESPDNEADEYGKALYGKQLRYLKSILSRNQINLFEDCKIVYAAACKTETKGSYKLPSKSEIASCRSKVMPIASNKKTKLIITLGFSGIYSLLGHRITKAIGTIDKWRGHQIPDQELKSWLCPTLSITDVLQQVSKNVYINETIFEQDIKAAIEVLSKPFPVYKEPKITYLKDLSALNKIKDGKLTAFDYETTGLKPHNKVHEIISCSIATSENKVFVFLLPKSKKKLKPLLTYLQSGMIPKVMQNIQFEITWSKVILGVDVNGIELDTMLTTHLLDNRTGVTGLKFQTYTNFGVIDYDSVISPYLSGLDTKDTNSPNRIKELLKSKDLTKKLLLYNALDSIFTLRLAKIQLERLQNHLPFY